jgi:hypothetical protein
VTAQAQLEALRLEAVEYYGERTAIDTAATTYRTDAARVADAAEQAALDDIAAARLLRRRSRAA